MSKVISRKEMKTKRVPNPARTKDMWFCIVILFLPCVNFCFLDMGNYVNMIRLAFKPTAEIGNWGILSNFVNFLTKFFSDPNLGVAIKNSGFWYLFGWMLKPLPLLTSYYIFRKFPGTKYFQIMLLLPGIVCGMVWTLVFKYFVDLVLPDMMGWPMGLMTNPDTKFLALVLYELWFTLGGGLMINTGMMNSVPKSVLEAGRLDGMNKLREFWHILMPAVYPVFVIGVVTGIMSFFSSQGNLFPFYGTSAPSSLSTIGYVMFTSVMGSYPDYGFNSAGSILFSLVVAPLSIFVKHMLEKYGPRDD